MLSEWSWTSGFTVVVRFFHSSAPEGHADGPQGCEKKSLQLHFLFWEAHSAALVRLQTLTWWCFADFFTNIKQCTDSETDGSLVRMTRSAWTGYNYRKHLLKNMSHLFYQFQIWARQKVDVSSRTLVPRPDAAALVYLQRDAVCWRSVSDAWNGWRGGTL